MVLGKFIYSLSLMATLTFAPQILANDAINLDTDPLANIKVSKNEISGSLDKLKNEGKISEADYKAAKAELANMSDAHITAIKEMAVGMIRNDPDKALSLVQAPKVDLEEAKRQIDALSNPK